jgi:RNA polymerase sigma factor (sigma-70 family)
MSPDEDVTVWLNQLKGGNRSAAEELWRIYYQSLVDRARQHLRADVRRGADEEDVALSAFDSFFRAVECGRFPRLDDRHDLWRVLVLITVRKAADLAKRETCRKRGEGRVALASELAEDAGAAFADLISREPDPALAAQVAENCQRLLAALTDPRLRAVAVLKMEGETNEAIAARLGISLSNVEFKLRGIREILKKLLEE